ncbi:hypothetical protein [Sphingomonas sp. Leaf4]|uniref:hypothetical protein n=1 Tax=Sphingomonas sp. Leaf4 TaxID=2876553 RepID=UPI001E28421A|nr:hypothetical protein [Sphingomonas sp. Leaf4]
MSQLSFARDSRALKGRLDRFVWENTTPEAVLLRQLLKRHFMSFEGVGIIGGLVRDFALGGRYAFKSDLDLVIKGDPREVAQLASSVGAVANRFGGFGYTEGPWKIDFWALQNTWAATAGHVAVRDLADLVQCTFFDWDAVVYDLRNRRVVCEKTYFTRIHSRQLEISLRSNPGEMGNLLRAARRIIRWRLTPGPVLTKFIVDRLNEGTFAALKASERRKYGDRMLDGFSSAAQLRAVLLDGPRLQLELAGQMALPLEPSS